MRISITKKELGQSLVETALVVPLLFLLIFTFIDLGRAVYYSSALGNSVREGARYASVNKIDYSSSTDTDLVRAKVDDYSVAVSVAYGDIAVNEDVNEPDTVTVSATYEFYPITPFLARILGLGNSITLKAESTMLLAPIAR